MKVLVTLVLAVSVLAAACSSQPEDNLIGLRASSDPAVGDARFLFAISEIDGTRRGAPDEKISVTATSVDDAEQVIEADAEFMWLVEDAVGLYRVALPFTRAGTWEIDWKISTGEGTDPFLVLVKDEPVTPGIGDPAPVVPTRTLDDAPIEDLTTDSFPDPQLYALSLDEALANGKPTVVVFATPAFCVSAACGPMLATVKGMMAQFPDVNWLHVEVYEGFNETGFEPTVDYLVEAVKVYNLPSEPWAFVMDGQGVVEARLEGAFDADELAAILTG